MCIDQLRLVTYGLRLLDQCNDRHLALDPPHDPQLLARRDEHAAQINKSYSSDQMVRPCWGFYFLWRDCSSLVVRHNDLCMGSPASVGSPSLSSYATTANRAEEKQAKIERAPQLAVPGVRPQVHLAEVGSPVHGHLDVQADFFTLRLRVLPVGPHRRPPHHLRTRERRTRSVRVACRSVACPAYRTFDSICRWSSRQTTAARASRARGDR
jgi:hypothetical protein